MPVANKRKLADASPKDPLPAVAAVEDGKLHAPTIDSTATWACHRSTVKVSFNNELRFT